MNAIHGLYRRFPFTCAILMTLGMGWFIGYAWGLQDHNVIHYGLDCDHRECIDSLRSPAAPFVEFLYDLPDYRAAEVQPSTADSDLIEIRILVPRKLLPQFRREVPELEKWNVTERDPFSTHST